MPWLDIYWDIETEQHIAQHGLTLADVRNAIFNPIGEVVSDSSGRPLCFGLAIDGRKIGVVYELIDDITVLPITAFEVK